MGGAQHSPALGFLLYQAKQDSSELEAKSKELKKSIAELEQREKDATAARDTALGMIGNLVHDSVPYDNNEDNNTVVKTWGSPRDQEGMCCIAPRRGGILKDDAQTNPYVVGL